MKIRQGFVSNSSSSSFVIAGFTISDDKVSKERIKELMEQGWLWDGSDIEEGCMVATSIASGYDDSSNSYNYIEWMERREKDKIELFALAEEFDCKKEDITVHSGVKYDSGPYEICDDDQLASCLGWEEDEDDED